ncbi:MAG TPA: TlpA disulfide reductase family protein [Pyrinomonadaceae bacterium]|nr:TlpA disulfide reductase family protein [Pyrinomonadaceae bacterium]
MRFIFSLAFCLLFALPVFSQQKSGEKPLAPSFNVVSIDGKTFDSKSLKGKIVVLNLWFINCPNCVEEIKLLNKIVDEYKDRDVVFLGIATNKKDDLEKFLKKNPFKYNIVPNEMQTILSFGEPDKNGEINIPFPMHIVLDREGAIVVRKSGVKGLDAVKNELKRLLESAPTKSD